MLKRASRERLIDHFWQAVEIMIDRSDDRRDRAQRRIDKERKTRTWRHRENRLLTAPDASRTDDGSYDHRKAELGLNSYGNRWQIHPRDVWSRVRHESISKRRYRGNPKPETPERIIEGVTHDSIARFAQRRYRKRDR